MAGTIGERRSADEPRRAGANGRGAPGRAGRPRRVASQGRTRVRRPKGRGDCRGQGSRAAPRRRVAVRSAAGASRQFASRGAGRTGRSPAPVRNGASRRRRSAASRSRVARPCASCCIAGKRKVREVWVATDSRRATRHRRRHRRDRPQRARPGAGGQPQAARGRGAQRGAPGRARLRRAAAARPTSTICSSAAAGHAAVPRRRRRRHRPGQPRRAAALLRRRRRAVASCCRAIVPCTSRRPSPRPRPAPSSTCRWRLVGGLPAALARDQGGRHLGDRSRRRRRPRPVRPRRSGRRGDVPRARRRGRRAVAAGARALRPVVSIPMLGRLSSLNVSAAAALAIYEVARQRRPK